MNLVSEKSLALLKYTTILIDIKITVTIIAVMMRVSGVAFSLDFEPPVACLVADKCCCCFFVRTQMSLFLLNFCDALVLKDQPQQSFMS